MVNVGSGSMFGSRNGSRRGSVLTNDGGAGGGGRNGSMGGYRVEEDESEYDSFHARKVSKFLRS